MVQSNKTTEKEAKDMMIPTLFITGGSRGIGSATVKRFTTAGYDVFFTYKNSKSEAEALSKETGATAIQADSGDPAAIKAAAMAAEERYGHIDVLINNAGIALSGLVTDHTDRELENLFAVDALGPLYAARALLPGMIRRKSGCIINVSSMWGIVGASCEVAYSAAKAAVIGMTKALAKEVGPSGIRVNCVAPGVIDTDMNSALTDSDMAELRDATPLGRIGAPEDVAELMLFLAGGEASFITGQIISADGGFAL